MTLGDEDLGRIAVPVDHGGCKVEARARACSGGGNRRETLGLMMIVTDMGWLKPQGLGLGPSPTNYFRVSRRVLPSARQ